MSSKPLINGKGVNKPFRSPFRNTKTPENENDKNNSNTPKPDSCKTTLRVSMSKHLLFQQTPPAKKTRLSHENSEQNADLNKSYEPHKNITEDTKLYRSDLDMLVKRVKDKQRCVDDLKTELHNKSKEKTEDLEAAIEKWISVCQSALLDFEKDIQNYEKTMDMDQIISTFGIDKNLIRFSDDTNSFY